jgi:diaminohydroxyphosphoribosylaminopyrimidine deaminase/5-amino-6-(5-phosphoribosylamino)uracil reductase
MNNDLKYMRRAIALAKKGEGRTCPNPMVGAVIVQDGQVIGAGWHHGPGLPHAEVEALRVCSESPKGATMYVTLEPCNHCGRTPPCTEAIIEAGIAAVKIAVSDPNPLACGGACRLREAGIVVKEGVAKKEALALNRSFFHHCLTGRPWVIMKAAMSLDGKIATASGESKWITGEQSRRFVHRLRSAVSAVLIGSGTMLADNPQLTNRTQKKAPQPLKVLIDSRLQLPLDYNLVRQNPERLIVICTQRADAVKQADLEQMGVRIIRQKGTDRVDLAAALDTLGELGIQSVLAEGGAGLFGALLEAGLVNEYYLFYAPFFIGGEKAPGVIAGKGIVRLKDTPRLQIEKIRRVGGDILVHAYKEELAVCLPV